MKNCIFCGQSAKTKEHIIPRWLQKHFGLKDQPLQMMNRTTVQYSRALLPACGRCNSEIFSQLETKVRQNLANEQDYYLWALKIRYCLSVIDSSYPDDRSNPSQGPILSDKFASIGHDFIRHAFTHLKKEKFYFQPYPFGSVFLLDNPTNDGEFGLVDVSHPYWALTIALPGNRILSVLFTDRGLAKRSILKRYKSKGGLDVLTKNLEVDIATRYYTQFLTFNLLLVQYQLSNIPYGVKLKEDGVYSNRLPNKLKYRSELQSQVLFNMANCCGLPKNVAQKFIDSQPPNFIG